MDRTLFILYLFYGFTYLSLGIRILSFYMTNERTSRVVHAFRYIALFGIMHGISEWLTMIQITQLFEEYNLVIYNVKYFFKAISFLALFQFAFEVMHYRYKRAFLRFIPLGLFIIYALIFTGVVRNEGFAYFNQNRTFNIIFMRYFLAFVGSMLVVTVLFIESKAQDTLSKGMKRRYRLLASAFILYGVIDGLIVRGGDFFPANILSNDNFYALFGFRIQILKIAIGGALYLLVTTLIRFYSHEQREKIFALQMQTYATDMRCKIGYEMHDSIIQDLYGIHLKMNALKNKQENSMSLDAVSDDVKRALARSREFMTTQTFKRINLYTLIEQTSALLSNYKAMSDTEVNLEVDGVEALKDAHPSYTLTQVYFALQEATLNAFKHAQAKSIEVSIKQRLEGMHFTVKDDGQGFDFNEHSKEGSFGLVSMKNRVLGVNGKLTIDSKQNGTIVTIFVPKEGAL